MNVFKATFLMLFIILQVVPLLSSRGDSLPQRVLGREFLDQHFQGKGSNLLSAQKKDKCLSSSMEERRGQLFADLRHFWLKEEQGNPLQFGSCQGDQAALLSTLPYLLHEDGSLLTEQLMKVQQHGLEIHLRFRKTPAIQNALTSLLIFYLPGTAFNEGETLNLSFTSSTSSQDRQVACISMETQYLIVNAEQLLRNQKQAEILLMASLRSSDSTYGSPLSLPDLQKRLIWLDECNNTVNPELLLLLPNELKATSSSLVDDSNSSPLGKNCSFLEELKNFLNSVVISGDLSEEGQPVIIPSKTQLHWDVAQLKTGRHFYLNISSSPAELHLLLNSNSPTLFSFSPRTVDHSAELHLNRHLLGQLNRKLAATLAAVSEHPELQKHDALPKLRRLLQYCLYPRMLWEGMEQVSTDVPFFQQQHNMLKRQYHALLLLKALQTVLDFWGRQTRRLSRQDRSQGRKGPCMLHPLTVQLNEYPHILYPQELAIDNCQGHCGFPQSTSTDLTNNHVVLLIKQHEKGPGLARPPCCVPVQYKSAYVAEIDEYGTKVSYKPDMIAEKCGCR
ncbi:muellerian-inhibiting factor isoform X2 [Polypterus senegalus]|uniref:muellerian-inhibiting factor isoform X2 n=1 Tax=Polypterus senegalus TaxID=55291 RepID=UPI001965DD9E|nr:muellerian-inhibiting factor isoform X2 [Polypterus senegalus]